MANEATINQGRKYWDHGRYLVKDLNNGLVYDNEAYLQIMRNAGFALMSSVVEAKHQFLLTFVKPVVVLSTSQVPVG